MRGRVLAAGTVVFLATAVLPARAQVTPSADPVVILDVPYVQQSEALCGGAAAAMVMRYWGETGVYAETFASLVDNSAGGIRGEALLSELRGRGWNARSFRGDASLVQSRLAARQPAIALIEDRPGVFHYVVIVAWTNGRVVLHDPARAPFRVVDEKRFDAAWEKSGRWTLLALPGESLKKSLVISPGEMPKDVVSPSKGSCASLVEHAVRLAEQGDRGDALQRLRTASELCPQDSAPWREMAGVHALQSDWTKAAAHARAAVQRDAGDRHAWRILATSSFVTGDGMAALDAWNRLGEPLIDTVTVGGLLHTRHPAATSLMGLEPQSVLTPRALTAANRRLDEMPAAESAHVTYRPLENGRAAVDAVVAERSRLPTSVTSLAAIGARTISERELRASVANPTGAGDMFTASWRWWENRPRVALSYAAPTPFGGLIRVDLFRDVQTYDTPNDENSNGDVAREVRKGGGVSLSNWTVRNLRWEVGAGVDAWDEGRKTVALTAGLDQRIARDHLSLRVTAVAVGGNFTTWRWGTDIDWRSSRRHEGHVLLWRAGVAAAGADAPLALWPGAGTGHARDVLLRGHPLLDDGIATGDVFGRRLYHAGAEWRRWFRPALRIVPIAPAVFIDSARAEKRLRPGEAWHVDAGAGMRIAVLGSGVLRVDLAKGLRDGKTTFSIGWTK